MRDAELGSGGFILVRSCHSYVSRMTQVQLRRYLEASMHILTKRIHTGVLAKTGNVNDAELLGES